MNARRFSAVVVFALALVLIAPPGCTSIKQAANDPVVRHCAAQTLVTGAIAGVAGVSLADSKASKTAAGVIGGVGGATAGFLLCRRAFRQAQEMQRQYAALEENGSLERAQATTGSVEETSVPEEYRQGGEQQQSEEEASFQPGSVDIQVVDNRATLLTMNSIFPTGSASLRAITRARLDPVASTMQKYPTSQVAILGHTDAEGGRALNRRLSRQRAEAVAQYLRAQGVTAGRFSKVEGLGESQPIADNATPEGRAQNRRVEIIVMPSPESSSSGRSTG